MHISADERAAMTSVLIASVEGGSAMGLMVDTTMARSLIDKGAVDSGVSKYQMKTRAKIDVHLTHFGRELLGRVSPWGPAEDGDCRECSGQGQHLRYSFDYQDCLACEGSGVCSA